MEFVATPNKTETGKDGRTVDLVVIHTMEIPEKGDTAEACARFFSRPTTRASAHYCVDNNTVVQCVNQTDVAWHCPGVNHDGIGVEHAGFARQTAADWDDRYSRNMLALSASLVASVTDRWDIPLVWLRAPDLAAGRRGITSHREASNAFRLSTHTDPGAGFPIQKYLAQVLRGAQRKPGAPTIKPPPPTLKLGDRGWRVKQAQKLLIAADQKLTADGVYGKWTQTAVKAFQKRAGLILDGVVGRGTWRALWQHYYVAQ